jgi:hypothetical protein
MRKAKERTMGMLGKIWSKIFNHQTTASAAPTTASPGPTPGNFSPTPSGLPMAGTAGAPGTDVMQVLTEMAQYSKEKLNWKESIVDLLKLLGLESDLAARKELAQELHYDSDMSDTAKMNVWLQKQVMQKLAENGGRVPNELRA